MKYQNKKRDVKAKFLVALLMMVLLLPTLFWAGEVKAEGDSPKGLLAPSALVNQIILKQAKYNLCISYMGTDTPCPYASAEETLEVTYSDFLGPLFKAVGLNALMSAGQYAYETLAYESAVMLAYGGPGKTPLYENRPADEVVRSFAAGVAGSIFESLNNDLEDYFDVEFNLCAPPDPIFRAGIALGIKGYYQPARLTCDWQAIQSNWEGFVQTVQQTSDDPTGTVLNEVAKGLQPGQNSLSYFVESKIQVQDKSLSYSSANFADLLSNSRFKGIVDLVTNEQETPADYVREQTKSQITGLKEANLDLYMSGAINSKELWGKTLSSFVSIFLNTYLSTKFSIWKNKLLDNSVTFDPFSGESSSSESLADLERRYSEQFYSDFVSTTPNLVDDYNVLSQFAVCTAGTSLVRQTNNCVIDSSLFNAIVSSTSEHTMTVAQAISEGKLHGSWALYPPDDLTHNQDAYCYSYGYCYGNLVKLRKARVIPVGWELAAASEQNLSSNPVTLAEVVAGFNDCNSDNKLDAEHPWCHLIDPNWVIKYPEQRCDASMIGEQLISADLAGRSGTCVDDPSCISKDADGNCIGYGYCVREKNTWDFSGDSCPEEYASCMSFANSETGVKNSWLFTTLDQNNCTAANAGCLWYRTNKYLSSGGTTTDESDDTFEWLPYADVYLTADRETDVLQFSAAGSPSARTTYYGYDSDSDGTLENTYDVYSFEDRVYFNSEVEECSEDSVGCTKVYPVNDEVSLNLIRNASFEDDEDNNGVADYWSADTSATYDESGSYEFDGTDMYSLTSGSELVQGQIHLQPNRFYTLSFYAEGSTSSSAATLSLALTDSENNDVDLSGYSTDCDVTGNLVELSTSSSLGTGSYASYDCTFTTPSLDDSRAWIVGELTVEGTGLVYVDAIQLEVGEVPSDFHEDYSGTLAANYLQLAPAWLGCEGKSTDPSECADYTQVCSATEVGCSLYTPAVGDPDVPAIISSADQCPVECVGYATYKQEATDYDAEEFPLYFIADSAQSCSSSYVGCDEFTNLETEEIETYSYLRACVTPEMDAGEVFFTWEGSDAAGYQLVSYVLLSSNLSSTTTINYDSGAADDTSAGNAPCVSWNVDSADSLVCDEDSTTVAALEADGECDEHNDILTNPDCREFYDSLGTIHYRLYSETVSVSDDCTAYRKTEADETDCEYSGGFFTTSGECRYYLEPNESTECPNSMAGCREYTGGSSRNSSSILTEYFESGTYDDYSAVDASLAISNESVAVDGHSLRVTTSAANATVMVSPDSLVAGKTYVLKFWAKGTGSVHPALIDNGGDDDSHFFSEDATELSTSWQLYEVGPLITVGDDFGIFDETAVLGFIFQTRGQTVYLDNIELVQTEENLTLIKDSWVTPSTCDETASGTSSPQYYLGCEEYSDQNDLTYYIYQFTSLCSESSVGCAAFYDTQNSISSYTQVFNATCYNATDTDGDGVYAYTSLSPDEDVVSSATSCYLDTTEDEVCTIISGRNSCQFNIDGDIPVPLPVNIVLGPETVYVPADEVVYLVASDDHACTSGNMGCIEVGIPTFSQDRTVVESFESAYLLNQPDSYNDILCANDELFCAEWASTQDGNYYFKDPGDQECEYKNGVSLNGVSYSGWFRTGTTEFCYGSGYCSGNTSTNCSNDAYCVELGLGSCVVSTGSYIKNGNESGIWYNGDDDYTGWAGACSSSYDLCSEFVEPLATEEGNSPEGTSYYFLDNEEIADENNAATERCEGQVGLLDGCVLFNDTMDTNLAYSASASYMASEHADILFGEDPRSLQDPISCPDGGEFNLNTGGTIDLCASRCSYTTQSGSEIVNLWGEQISGTQFLGGSCISDNDCQLGVDQSNREVEGTCLDISSYTADGGLTYPLSGYTLENDTNRSIRVYRDRQCAEWLACNSSQASWDEKSNTWVEVCQEVGLCDEFSNSSGQGFCSSWVNEPATILDSDKYSARDVSWYGLDYSGYAIPNLLPVQYLTQYDTSPYGYCYSQSSGILHTDQSCSSSLECGLSVGADAICVATEDLVDDGYTVDDSEQWYLVYQAGTCDGANGESCTAGYCVDTGRACSGDGDCATGECIVGYCENPAVDSYCSETLDCASYGTGYTCENGSCVELIYDADGERETCMSDDSCSSGECVPGALAKTGTCFNNVCLVDRDGSPFSTDYAEAKACRGYPEINSPFPASKIVDTWLNPADYGTRGLSPGATPESQDSIPYDYAYGFRDTPVCAPVETVSGHCSITTSESCLEDADCGTRESCVLTYSYSATDDCLCSYEKAVYGQGSTTRFYPLETGRDDVLTGVCSSGNYPGKECTDDSECGDGHCEILKRLDTVYGWDGYCLERDISSPLFGSTDQQDRACLTWLPVDKLNGSRDAYANDLEAGFNEGDTYYCAEIGEAYNIGTTDAGCAEGYGACQDDSWEDFVDEMCSDGDCLGSVVCPEGFFAVMGGCGDLEDEEGGGFTGAVCPDDGDKDCPFFCVPKASYKTEADSTYGAQAGDPCLAPGASEHGPDLITEESSCDVRAGVYTANSIRSSLRGGTLESGQNFYVYIPSGNFQDVVEYYNDCEVDGVLSDGLTEYISPYLSISTIPTRESGIHGFDGLDYNIGTYAACTSVVQVSSSTPDSSSGNYNQAWTNRTWTQNPSLYSLEGSHSEYLGYTVETSSQIFGQTIDPNVINSLSDPYPHHVGVCTELDPALDGFSVTTPEVIENVEVDGSCPSDGLYKVYGADSPEAMPFSTILGLSSGDRGEVNDGDILSIYCDGGDCDNCSDDSECNSGVTCDLSSYDPSDPESEGGECVGGLRDGDGCLVDSDCYFLNCQRETDVDTGAERTFCNYIGSVTTTLSVGGYSSARSLLKQIFAESYALWSFDDGYDNISALSDDGVTTEWSGSKGGFTKSTTSSDWVWDDVTAEGDDYGLRFNDGTPTPPTIASVGLCYGTLCLEQAENKFSVNGYDSDDLFSSGGSYHTTVNFFAWANSNQMPLRNITVDWGDGGDDSTYDGYAWPLDSQSGTLTDENSYYKNRRGLADRNTSYCGDPDEFGLSDPACMTAYFSFNHDYTCSQFEIETTNVLPTCEWADEATGRLKTSPCKDTNNILGEDAEDKCVFQPRVHVKDNWGWCTGECDTNLNGTAPYCYGDSECSTDQCPSLRDNNGDGVYDGYSPRCADGDRDKEGSLANPWINYDGVIILDWQNE